MNETRVPFFQVNLSDHEIDEVVATLRSGWLTTGPKVRQFEEAFAAAVGAKHAVALNSCTAALHLALEALRIEPQQAVLIPTMNFAATAEVALHLGAIPLLVDCEPTSPHISIDDATEKIARLRSGDLSIPLPLDTPVVGVVPVHVGGKMVDMRALRDLASSQGLWIVDDAAHAFPAAWRADASSEWQHCGQGTGRVSCFSFYANKTVTTGEGGMAVTEDSSLADRMRLMSLHGFRYETRIRETWNYQITSPGFKYNMTDIAAALGIGQLAHAEEMRRKREVIAERYITGLADVEEVELPTMDSNRIHSWHLFQISLKLDQLNIDRNRFVDELKALGIGCSVHWRPLHLHEYYQKTLGWRAEDFPNATKLWERLISLPFFPTMSDCQIEYVISSIKELCKRYAR